ncbi:methylmalonyl-CoA mutase family protein [Kitasatospora indigofera]
MDVDAFAPRLSFFWAIGMNFFMPGAGAWCDASAARRHTRPGTSSRAGSWEAW